MGSPIYTGGRPYFKSGIRFKNNIANFSGSAAPTNGTSGTGAGFAGPGSTYQRSNGLIYVNNNTKASPTWVSLGIGGSVSGLVFGDYKVLAAQIDYAANVTPAVITGFSWTVVAGATYIFEVNLPTTMTTVGGLTVSFVLTTATLTSIQYQTYASTAVDNSLAVSTNGTTASSTTKVFDSKTSAYTHVNIKGSFVVNAGGTFQWDACQNTSAGAGDTSSLLLGGFAKLDRVL